MGDDTEPIDDGADMDDAAFDKLLDRIKRTAEIESEAIGRAGMQSIEQSQLVIANVAALRAMDGPDPLEVALAALVVAAENPTQEATS